VLVRCRSRRIECSFSEQLGQAPPLVLRQDRLSYRETDVNVAADDTCLEHAKFAIPI
jgi:hypothetical protein